MNKPDIGKTARRVLTHLGALILCTSAATAAVEISAKPTANMTCSGGVCSPTAKKAVLNVNDLAGMLASGDVTVASGAQAKDIEIDAALSWTSANRLTLDSYRAITFNKPVEVTGPGGLTITTNDGGKDGDYTFKGTGHVKFWDISSELFINGTFYTLAKNFKQISLDVRHDIRFIAFAGDYNARKLGTLSVSPMTRVPDTFEGLGNAVSNLTIVDNHNGDLVALFPGSGNVRDLRVLNVNILGTGVDQLVGGLAGRGGAGNIPATVQNCFVTGQVEATGDNSFAGGLMGFNSSTLIHSYANVTVSAQSNGFAGGLVGGNAGSIDQSFSTGAVSADDNSMAGGLAGENKGGTISNSFATGSVTVGDNSAVGGLAGATMDLPSESLVGHIETSYSTGTVTVGSGDTTGGFVGEDLTATRNISSSYWDLDTSGISDPSQGAGNIANDAGITGLTDTQLKAGLPSGFDKKVWAQKASINSGYPYLIAYPPPN